ncbi:WcaG protein [Microscilla marina ATCC 23134]|uniref:WcaG protein n=2 Tax=Microscilla marina TaxID=1027 RepID=A1ZDW4_MICM2|nr:WcaG protein [Microscilla marina ATCC 23134]
MKPVLLCNFKYNQSNTMTQQSTVSILGCGWLGLPLAEHLMAQGYHVKGSTTQTSKLDLLHQKGIEAFLVKLTPDLEADKIEQFLDTETLVINIPPGVRKQGEDFHPAQIKTLEPLIGQAPLKNVIYVSSTSVYPNVNRMVDETEPLGNTDGSVDGVRGLYVNRALLKAEQMIKGLEAKNVTILRPGGLIGEDRVPGKYVAGKKGITTGNVPVNYIHPVDLVRLITQVIQQNAWGEVFNVVTPEHPTRREVYTQNIEMFGLEAPEYTEGSPDFKIIDGTKIIETLNYKFKYPNPLEFRYNL